MGERSDTLFCQQRTGDDGPGVLIENERPIVGVWTEGAELVFDLFPLVRLNPLCGTRRPAMPSGSLPSDHSIEPGNQRSKVPKRLRTEEIDGVARTLLSQRGNHRHRLHEIAKSRQLYDKRSGHDFLGVGHIHCQHTFFGGNGLSEFNQSFICGSQRAQLIVFLTRGIHLIGPQ